MTSSAEPQITATRAQAAAALAEWRETAAADGYDVPPDGYRDEERADYLFYLLRKHGAG